MTPHQQSLARRCADGALLACLALCGSLFATAQEAPAERPNARPFFWRVDGAVPCYLFGTFHLPDERVTDLHPDVERALADCDALFTEQAMDTMMWPAPLQATFLPAGQTLHDIAPDEMVQRVLRRLGMRDPASWPLWSKRPLLQMRPALLSVQVFTKPGSGERLDSMIYCEAKSAGKQVDGLETIDEQLAVFEGLGLDGEVARLKVTLDLLDDYERRGLDLREQMIQAYCDGDTKRMAAFFDAIGDAGDVWAELNRTMRTDRNLRMAERIDRHLHAEPQRRFVFAVGAGHLIGETNVVDLLRARGYTVTRVPESAANLDEEIEQLRREVEVRQERIRELQARRAALPEPRKKAG
jgi:uncharacterized protein YbaP (TraB family)